MIFICVGTPSFASGEADLSAVEQVARRIAETVTAYKLVVEKSTGPVQTGRWIERTLAMYTGGLARCDVASNPEFLREGSAVEEFLHPDRIVIGVGTARDVRDVRNSRVLDRVRELENHGIDVAVYDPALASKARKKLGWEPRVTFKELVGIMIDLPSADVIKDVVRPIPPQLRPRMKKIESLHDPFPC